MLLLFFLRYFSHFNLFICSFFATTSHISSVVVKHNQRKNIHDIVCFSCPSVYVTDALDGKFVLTDS